jgi:hypothetical protein
MGPDADDRTVTQRRLWHYWKGSPELFAHAVRAAGDYVTEGDGDGPTTRIDVHVRGDREAFSSADGFLANVTTEALRGFDRIEVEVSGDDLHARWSLGKVGHWWKPARRHDADVVLEVSGRTDAQVGKALDAIAKAVARGVPRWDLSYLVGVAIGLVAMAVGYSGAYLLEVHESIRLTTAAAIFAGASVPGVVWGAWLIPALEVAPRGQSRLRRVVRVLGGIALSVLAAGAGKAIWG